MLPSDFLFLSVFFFFIFFLGKNVNGGKMLSSPGRRTRAEIAAASIAIVESPISAAVTSVTLTSSVKMRKLSSGKK